MHWYNIVLVDDGSIWINLTKVGDWFDCNLVCCLIIERMTGKYNRASSYVDDVGLKGLQRDSAELYQVFTISCFCSLSSYTADI